MTFLEVVFASAMLGVVAAALFGAYSFAEAAEAREQRRLGAVELANRLMLNYLDSPTGMPEKGSLVEYVPKEAPLKYRWELLEEPARVVEPRADRRDRARESPLTNDRFVLITVRVWLSEQSGGSRVPEAGTARATLTRLVDPIAVRNPDSYMAMVKNQKDFEVFARVFMGKTVAPGRPTSGIRREQGGVSPREAMGKSRARAPAREGGR